MNNYKRYRCAYYAVNYKGEDKENRSEKFLGSLEFFHANTGDFPVERKAFLVASEALLVANRLEITELR